jgi:hypothetical protein
LASADIVVRPAPRGAALPALAFPLAAGESIGLAHNGSPHLWSFQTAFRWHFAAVRADAQWSDQLSDLVRAFRLARGLGSSGTINAATWNAVVGGSRITAARQLSAAITDAWSVFQPPWQTAMVATVIPTEADIMELVQPLSVANDVWRVPREPSIVDVLLHHRDTRPVVADGAYGTVYRASAATLADILALPTALPAGATIVDLVQRWPRAALRVIQLVPARRTVP